MCICDTDLMNTPIGFFEFVFWTISFFSDFDKEFGTTEEFLSDETSSVSIGSSFNSPSANPARHAHSDSFFSKFTISILPSEHPTKSSNFDFGTFVMKLEISQFFIKIDTRFYLHEKFSKNHLQH